MSFDSSWDVDKYKSEHENEDHWQFRRQFLIEHKDKYPEDRLVCLAQVFFNIEFLGCTYPKKTMDLVEKLSEGLADDLREKRDGKLKRTFVAASDAAEARAKNTRYAMNNANNKICQYRIVPMTLNDKESVKEFLKNYFFRHEPLVVCLRLFEDAEAMEKLYEYAFKTLDNGLTFKAISLSGDLIGVILNEIQLRDSCCNEQKQNGCSNEEDFNGSNNWEKLMEIFQKVLRESDIFGRYPEINRIINIQIVAVNEAFRGKGLCTALFDKAKQLALDNQCAMVHVGCSSYFSAKAAKKLGFKSIYHLSYRLLKNKHGEVIFNTPAPHEMFKTYVLFIKNNEV